jgi:hypothetical protein
MGGPVAVSLTAAADVMGVVLQRSTAAAITFSTIATSRVDEVPFAGGSPVEDFHGLPRMHPSK